MSLSLIDTFWPAEALAFKVILNCPEKSTFYLVFSLKDHSYQVDFFGWLSSVISEMFLSFHSPDQNDLCRLRETSSPFICSPIFSSLNFNFSPLSVLLLNHICRPHVWDSPAESENLHLLPWWWAQENWCPFLHGLAASFASVWWHQDRVLQQTQQNDEEGKLTLFVLECLPVLVCFSQYAVAYTIFTNVYSFFLGACLGVCRLIVQSTEELHERL